MDCEQVGRLIAEQLHGVAALDQAKAFGDEPFELDGADLGAVLDALALLLRLFVGIEVALDARNGPVEQVYGRPEERLEIGLEARVAQGRDQCIEDVGHGAGDGVAVGQRSRIGLVFEGTMCVELELREDVAGRRRSMCGLLVEVGGHGRVPLPSGRAHRGLPAIPSRRAERACTAGA